MSNRTMKTKLEKHVVCAQCLSVGATILDCVCTYQNNYKTIELEFEICECCGNLIEDGYPADTEFNRQQLK